MKSCSYLYPVIGVRQYEAKQLEADTYVSIDR